MPWRGPSEPGEYPTLGFEIIDWITDSCAIPDGDRIGDPFVLTPEMERFVLRFYRLTLRGQFVYRRAMLVRPQKWGKGPFSASLICAEAQGPVLFDGWDADGEPVGRPWSTPWIQVTAVSEDQTDNVFRSLVPMIELGALQADMPDTGETRINLPGGGKIEPVTASARSRLGQRITYAVQDETHSWTARNGGHRLADNQRRNLAGMSGRSIETTNSWDPMEESVAQISARAAEKVKDILVDMAKPPPGSLRNKRERRKILRSVYGDSATQATPGAPRPWVDLERIEADIDELIERNELAQAERFFANRITATADYAFDFDRWKALARDGVERFKRRSLIVLGFDGGRFHDATALIGTHIETGYQWPLGIWESDGTEGWEVPEPEVADAVDEAFAYFDVWRLYADPPYWETSVDAWAGKHGADRVVRWWTNRPKAMAYALRSYATSMGAGEVTHNGDATFSAHVRHARKRVRPGMHDEDGRPLWTIEKDRPGSPDKIDAAMAGCLSWEARGDAIAAGVIAKKRRRVVMA